MIWRDLRGKYPDSWVLFEAAQAHSDEGKRIVDDIAILDKFTDRDDAMKAYRNIHKKRSWKRIECCSYSKKGS